MQTVFEKIIEELEKNASRYTKKYVTPYGNNGYRDTKAISVNKAIEIVKQEAEKYNNGWVPCNELLPAYGQTVLASVCAEDAEWKIIIACYKEEDFWLDGKIDAWQPLPTPYAKGE